MGDCGYAKGVVEEQHKSWLSSFPAVFLGFVLVFAGFGGLGWWLAATGQRAEWQMIGTGIATVVFFAVGFTLLTIAGKRRGGLLRWRPSRRELDTYKQEYRHP